MSWIEFIIAMLTNFKELVGVVLIVLLIVGLCSGFVLTMSVCMEDYDAAWLVKYIRPTLLSLFSLLAIYSLPSVDNLWRVRIGLIKLQLASPENIQKGADVIERIGAKLECKYLGCEEKKKN